jgi:hypothetical protein
MCSPATEEDIDHLFFYCPFALASWQKLGIPWNGQLNVCDKILEVDRQMSQAFFMDIVIITLWEIWNMRNSKSFDGYVPLLRLWTRKFRDQGFLKLVRVREDQRVAFLNLLETVS